MKLVDAHTTAPLKINRRRELSHPSHPKRALCHLGFPAAVEIMQVSVQTNSYLQLCAELKQITSPDLSVISASLIEDRRGKPFLSWSWTTFSGISSTLENFPKNTESRHSSERTGTQSAYTQRGVYSESIHG